MKLLLAVKDAVPSLQGKWLWPPPPPKVDPASPAAAAPTAAVVKEPPPPPNYFAITMKDALTYTAGLGTCLGEWPHSCCFGLFSVTSFAIIGKSCSK